jgi:hypothetical protein
MLKGLVLNTPVAARKSHIFGLNGLANRPRTTSQLDLPPFMTYASVGWNFFPQARVLFARLIYC